MVRGTLNAQRNPGVGADDSRACVFTFIDDPGEGAKASAGGLRKQYRSVDACEDFARKELKLQADMGRQLASSLESGENSTVEIELEDEIYVRYFAAR